jgi:predicted RNase H-like HicB family nuclease
MPRRFTAVITREEAWYVAHCVELGAVSQGKTIEEAQAKLREAVELYPESFGDEDLPESTGEVLFYPLEVATWPISTYPTVGRRAERPAAPTGRPGTPTRPCPGR